VTGLLAPRPARDLRHAGRGPGLVIARLASLRAARSGAAWGLVFGLFIIVQTLGYTSAYKTPASRAGLERAYGTNTGLNALLGQAHDIGTVAGWASWRFIGILGILGALWGLLTSTRLLRGEEDAGRYDLLLAGQTTRRRGGAQALAGLGAGLLALFIVTSAGTIVAGRPASVGFTIGQCLYFSVTLVTTAAMFLAIGALASQLASTRRSAVAIGGAVFAIAFALRMVADSDQHLHWLIWLSPLGWAEETRPLTSPDPAALLPPLLLVTSIVAVTLHLAGSRDVGAAAIPGRDTSRPHTALLGGPTRLAVRLMRPAAIGWLLATTGFALLLGSVAQSSAADAAGSRQVQQAIGRLGGHGSVAAAYLGLTFLILSSLIALSAAGQVAAMRTEEASGHLENLLVRPVSRASWLAGRLTLSGGVLITAGLAAGLAAWAAAAGQRSGFRPAPLLAAGLNIVPAGLFLLGLGTLMLGAWPRRASAVAYGYLAWSFLTEFAGGIIHTSHWLLDTSVFFHMAPAPATSPDWQSAAIITCLGTFGSVFGAVLLARRDEQAA
jgi:ABC-2 type transport system permease protein